MLFFWCPELRVFIFTFYFICRCSIYLVDFQTTPFLITVIIERDYIKWHIIHLFRFYEIPLVTWRFNKCKSISAYRRNYIIVDCTRYNCRHCFSFLYILLSLMEGLNTNSFRLNFPDNQMQRHFVQIASYLEHFDQKNRK